MAIPAPHSRIAASSNSERLAISLFDRLWDRYRERVSYVNVYEVRPCDDPQLRVFVKLNEKRPPAASKRRALERIGGLDGRKLYLYMCARQILPRLLLLPLCLLTNMRTRIQEIVASHGATFFNDHIALRSLALQVDSECERERGEVGGGRGKNRTDKKSLVCRHSP